MGSSPSSRILHVLWALDIGGAERAVYQLVREQRRTGIEADVAVGSHRGLYGDKTQEAGASVFELGQRNAYDPLVARRAIALFRRYEIIHFHSAEPVLIGLASQVPGRKYYTHRSGQFDYSRRQALRYRATGFALRRTFAGVSANGHQAMRAASELFGIPLSSIKITYNGLDFELLNQTRPRAEIRRELAVEEATFCVATTGNIRRWKRIDLLIRAIALMGTNDTHCFVVGDGPDRPRLEKLAADTGTADRVTFVGEKENVADYLYAMDAFVLPSGPEEGFGNSAVEAMALGLPTVVFSDGGGLLEHVQNGVTGFVVASVPQLAETLAGLRNDAALSARVGASAAAFVRENYSLSRMLAAYAQLYQL